MNTTFLQLLSNQLEDIQTSDLHICADENLWIRRAGDLLQVANSSSVVTNSELNSWLASSRYKDTPCYEAIQDKGGQDDFASYLGGFRLRIHVYISRGKINVSARKLSTEIPLLESLGLPKEFHKVLSAPTGLILVVGATGSGKSTTLASALDHLNASIDGHIITLEDPVEFVHNSKRCRIRQRQVGGDSDCKTFADGVIASLREDPDIVLVGEVRDKATMEACLTASQTGHLVLATLHTNSAVETIERILSFYPESERNLARSVLSSVLRGVIAQRLVKKRDGGRVLAAELLISTPAIRANIAQNQLVQIEQTMETGRHEGQRTMNQSLVNLVENQIITRDEALAISSQREALEKRI